MLMLLKSQDITKLNLCVRNATFCVASKWAILTKFNNSDILAHKNAPIFHFKNFAVLQNHEFWINCTQSKCKMCPWQSKFSDIWILLPPEISNRKLFAIFHLCSYFCWNHTTSCQKFLKATNLKFLKSSNLQNDFCTFICIFIFNSEGPRLENICKNVKLASYELAL